MAGKAEAIINNNNVFLGMAFTTRHCAPSLALAIPGVAFHAGTDAILRSKLIDPLPFNFPRCSNSVQGWSHFGVLISFSDRFGALGTARPTSVRRHLI
jgi:hypothetical protein